MDSIHGNITIDDVSLDKIPRDIVRDKIITVSQDQFVLPGSIRYNIDPKDEYSTETIIDALTSTDLWETVQNNGGLDAELKPHAFSHGQRHLFFLARAIVKRDAGKLVLLDEVTSRYVKRSLVIRNVLTLNISVDAATEERVRQVIEDKFHDHTIISIAHRLETVLDFSKVMILEKGKVVGYGKPKELLQAQSTVDG